MTESSASYRVKVRKEFIPLYKDVIRRKIFQQHAEFFTLCCCIGHSMTPVDQPISTEALFQAYTFTEYQRTVFKCFAFKQTGTILEEKELYSHVEKIADQGCQHLVENILTDLVFVDENGVVSLKPGQELEMQKKLSTFVSNQLINVPF